jgi:hypothetical protein
LTSARAVDESFSREPRRTSYSSKRCGGFIIRRHNLMVIFVGTSLEFLKRSKPAREQRETELASLAEA